MNDNVVTCTQNTIISALYICKVLRMMFILSLSCFLVADVLNIAKLRNGEERR